MTLLDYLRDNLRKSPEVQDIFGSFQKELDELWEMVGSAGEQLVLETATWGIDFWELALGLEVEVNRENEFRKSRIKARLRGQGSTTVETIREVAASFSNGEVEVRELFQDYRIEIEFVGQVGLPPNLEDLKQAIREVLPAHLEPWYLSQLRCWDDLQQNWDECGDFSWESLRGGSL